MLQTKPESAMMRARREIWSMYPAEPSKTGGYSSFWMVERISWVARGSAACRYAVSWSSVVTKGLVKVRPSLVLYPVRMSMDRSKRPCWRSRPGRSGTMLSPTVGPYVNWPYSESRPTWRALAPTTASDGRARRSSSELEPVSSRKRWYAFSP